MEKKLYIYMIFNNVHIFEKDTRPCRPLITLGRIRSGRRWMGHIFQLLSFFHLSLGWGLVKGREPFLAVELHQHIGMGSRPVVTP